MGTPQNDESREPAQAPAHGAMTWMDVARGELGVREIAGREHHPKIIEYHSTTTLKATTDEVPWCAAFVCWVLQTAGYTHTRSAAARSYINYGLPCDMQIGAICVLERGNSGGHVGFVTEFNDDHVVLLGGNQGNAVNMSVYDRSRVLATRMPVKDNES